MSVVNVAPVGGRVAAVRTTTSIRISASSPFMGAATPVLPPRATVVVGYTTRARGVAVRAAAAPQGPINEDPSMSPIARVLAGLEVAPKPAAVTWNLADAVHSMIAGIWQGRGPLIHRPPLFSST